MRERRSSLSRQSNKADLWWTYPPSRHTSLDGDSAAINDAGEIVGEGDAPDGQASATLWRKTGRKWQTTYLGTLHSGDCARAVSINASGQVIGDSGPNGCSTTLPFLWEDGGPMMDLNTLVPPDSGLQLFEAGQIAGQINDRGEMPTPNSANSTVASSRFRLRRMCVILLSLHTRTPCKLGLALYLCLPVKHSRLSRSLRRGRFTHIA
jgi:probable HAF family extracellular repeat protein